MELSTKLDRQEAEERMAAWWEGAVIDRAVVQVTAPSGNAQERKGGLRPSRAEVLEGEQLLDWFTDPEQVIPRLERHVASTYWGGEAFPVVFPVSIGLVAILSAYLGCPYRLLPGGNTGWADPILDGWDERLKFAFDPQSEWWLVTKRLLEAASRRAPGRYYVGVPDLNGPGEILALLRGTEPLAIDLLEADPALIKAALIEVTLAWRRYWEASVGTIHQWVGSYFYWMGIWSDRPSTDLQNDFSCLISPEMFEEFFLPSLEMQTRWVERTIYHLDGPGAVRHLDLLLSLSELDGIQWVPGAGAPRVSTWIRLLRRIQAKGKLLVLSCESWEVEPLLSELEPEGLLLSTRCESQAEADALLGNVARWTAGRQWAVA